MRAKKRVSIQDSILKCGCRYETFNVSCKELQVMVAAVVHVF
jgi:hypothetical protein